MTVIRQFNRYELKYVLHVSQVPGLIRDLLHFMGPDEHTDEDGSYRVTSLYYDSPDLHFYRSKRDGLRYRRKLRIRVYPSRGRVAEDDTAFVEIKQRMNQTVQKRRIVLPLRAALAHCSLSADGRTVIDPRDAAASSEILYMVRALRLRPTCIVSYRRRAFVGSRYERGMRLTFDSLLSGRTNALDLTGDTPTRLILGAPWVVMEIKVDNRVPDWTTSLVAKHECQLQRVSKYCLAVAQGLRLRSSAQRRKEAWTSSSTSSPT
jgi:SPX domain protein involved in polyphosphate accumulation